MGDAHDAFAYQEAARFQYDLYRYWRAVRETGALAIGTRGYLALAAFRKLVGKLASDALEDITTDSGEAHAPRLLFVRRLLERLDLLVIGPELRLCAADPTVMAAFLDLSLAERLRRCVRVWVAGGWWADNLDKRRPLPALRAPAPPRIALARRHLLQDLLALAPGARHPIPTLLLDGRSTLVAGSSGLASSRGARAGASEGVTERAALLGPLCWLGLVAPAGREPTQATDATPGGCHATPALDALRGSEASADLVEQRGRIVIQANFEIVAYPPLAAPPTFILDCCAEPRGVERAARYALTRHSLAGARRLGWPSGAVAARLTALAGGSLPQNVVATLTDWDRQADRVALLRPATLLEVRDATLLDALLRDGQSTAWVVRRLTPHAALIQERHLDEVRGWLLRHGEMPALVGRSEEATPGQDE